MCGVGPIYRPPPPEFFEALARQRAITTAALAGIAKTPEDLVKTAEAVRFYVSGDKPNAGDSEA